MKCQQCSTDAPAETDPHSGRLRCSKCHAFFGSGTTQTAAVRHARDILQKWSAADLLDQISSFPQVPALTDPVTSGLPDASQQDDPSGEPSGADLSLAGSEAESDPESDSAAEETETPLQVEADVESPILSLPSVEPSEADGDESTPITDESVEDAAADDMSPAADPLPRVETPLLSIMRVEETAQSSDSAESSSSASQVQAETADSDAPVPPAETKKIKSRRLRRPPVRRRRPRPAADSVTEQQTHRETVQEGMDAVKKKLRVDRPGPQLPVGEMTGAALETTVDPRAQDASTTRRFRIDAAEGVQDLTDGGGRVRSQGRSHRRFVDEAHESAGLRGPHFEVSPPGRSSLTSLTGQFLAYIGVLGLTVGTAIVIYGHFGGMSEYTPTGWLVTTVAQMLLFLGIINLVSGGIEQNNEDVSRRINVLGEQLMRIEQVTETAMRGPKIAPERYAGQVPAEDVHEREAAWVEDRR